MTYANDKSCANIIGVIADTIREHTAAKVSSAQYMSFIIDGDTDVSVKECEIVYVRILVDGQPTNILVGHVEVEHASADGIYAATKSAFAGLGESCQNWLQKTVAMGADGAAVNLGRKGGVAAKLQEEAGKHIIPFHCMPHRLELALLSAQKDSPCIGNVYNLLHWVWKTYHFSCKSRRELKSLGVELGVSVNNPSGVRGTRWLPHVSRSLDVLLKPGKKEGTLDDAGQHTVAHMDHLAASSTNADIAGRAKKVKETREDGSFLAFCHFLADLFTAISKYNLLLQRNDVILPQLQLDCISLRNGCDCALAEEEFQALKTLVFRSFKDKSYKGLWDILLTKEPYCSDFKNILHLVRIMLVLPVSSAQCERGFSTQKRIKSDIRSALNPKTVEDLIRISVEGPPLETFDASVSVKRWMEEGQRARRPNFKSWPQDIV
ncbi:hypothetical protein SKAU_G00067840 [Synaphobranchus kaupii]|uniref:HAT C-terminal dimerisation domain-containing protein n=1 Tax=Synaphobranchus kaupii TaxID=118154 RepID=A0A9Q1G656_SYNKA|nr:hypothetical protein SKAU_G00067840 [Synaphobranchus kaupii]